MGGVLAGHLSSMSKAHLSVAMTAETSLPAFDASNKSPSKLTLTFEPASIKFTRGSDAAGPAKTTQRAPLVRRYEFDVRGFAFRLS